jgi:hypothetical protein
VDFQMEMDLTPYAGVLLVISGFLLAYGSPFINLLRLVTDFVASMLFAVIFAGAAYQMLSAWPGSLWAVLGGGVFAVGTGYTTGMIIRTVVNFIRE